MLATEDYLYFTDRALDGMTAIVTELGDALACARPFPGANTPYGLLTHCLGVIETWAGRFVAGRHVERDRDAEFRAVGTVEALLERTRQVRRAFHEDVTGASPRDELRFSPPAEYLGPTRRLNQAAALQHVFEELAQHHGQMEILRDLLVATTTPAAARER